MNRNNAFIALAILAVTAGGCTQALKSTTNAEGPSGVFKLATQHDVANSEYVIDPPDEIVIKATNIKEIDAVKQTVRADGKISLNLLGEVKVSGLTPGEAQKTLTAIAAKYYTNPDIKIEVIANSKFFVIVGLGVNQQKKVPYTGNDNVIKALAEAGLDEKAWPEQVLLIRPERPGHPAARAVIDFNHIATTGDVHQNYAIEQGDILNVRDSPLASFNRRFTQLAGPITGATEAGNAVSPGRGVP